MINKRYSKAKRKGGCATPGLFVKKSVARAANRPCNSAKEGDWTTK